MLLVFGISACVRDQPQIVIVTSPSGTIITPTIAEFSIYPTATTISNILPTSEPIFENAATPFSTSVNNNTEYTIQAGDTLSGIAAQALPLPQPPCQPPTPPVLDVDQTVAPPDGRGWSRLLDIKGRGCSRKGTSGRVHPKGGGRSGPKVGETLIHLMRGPVRPELPPVPTRFRCNLW